MHTFTKYCILILDENIIKKQRMQTNLESSLRVHPAPHGLESIDHVWNFGWVDS